MCSKKRKKERMAIRASVFPSKRCRENKKRWAINSDEDIKLGRRLKFEFQDIAADMKPPNQIQCN